ncbi:MAG: T9SS type A sorting domain-containing protein, partial [Melioribacter sp.]|nr:T9SS type A sorting domain-containing protein [Melioribacter sp.]
WHNSPLYNGGYQFPCCPGSFLPSTDSQVNAFIAKGIPANKLGIGIDFYGYVWNGGNGTATGGVTKPRQEWITDPWVQSNVPYYSIMEKYYHSQYYGWDDDAKASYLSIDNSGSVNDKFISYDDEKSVQAKFDYARTKGIGGLIIWELGGGYRANQVAGQQDVLLQAVKNARVRVADVSDTTTIIPVQFTLKQNYPNPFNPETVISYRLAVSCFVSLKIYDILGNEVATLVNEFQQAGIHNSTFIIHNSTLPSGVYFYRLQAGEFIQTKKMLLIK